MFIRTILQVCLVTAITSLLPPRVSAQDALDLRSPTLNHLHSQILAGVPNAESDFFARLVTPLVEPVDGDEKSRLVTFIWRGNTHTKRVSVMGGRPKEDFGAPLARLPDTDLWYRTELLPSDSRFVYWTTVNPPAVKSDLVEGILNEPDSEKDPFNPNTVREDSADAKDESYVVLPDALPFPYTRNPKAPPGQSIQDSIHSTVLNSDLGLNVYLPAGHGEKESPPWLLIAFDGGFQGMGPVLDDLIATGKIPPLVVVGVVNRCHMRRKDLGYSEPFAKFVVEELLPWAQERFHTTKQPAQTILAGVSRGGGMAAFVALRYPHAFSNVLCLSTAIENEPGGLPPTRFWLRGDDGWLIERYLEQPTQPYRFYLAVGRFDTSLWTDRLVNNRRFRDMLRGKGYQVRYEEANAGHDELFFQHGYTEGLISLTTLP